MRRAVSLVVALGLVVLGVGCSSTPSSSATPAPDVAADTAPDVQASDTPAVDVLKDVAADTAPADVAPDVAADVAVDVSAVEVAAPKTWQVATTATKTFDPADLTIAVGDSVKFTVGAIHTATQVSKATWDASGNTPLSGGFDVPGGTSQTIAFNVAGTIYYVCKPHASLGMKGKITVQ